MYSYTLGTVTNFASAFEYQVYFIQVSLAYSNSWCIYLVVPAMFSSIPFKIIVTPLVKVSQHSTSYKEVASTYYIMLEIIIYFGSF